MDEGITDKVHQLKLMAKALRNNGDLQSAYSKINEAIQILEEVPDDPMYQRDVVFPILADLYGMQGGILRRSGNESAALRSYESGRVYERWAERGTTIYNQSQLALSLWLGSDHSKNDQELSLKLKAAIRNLEQHSTVAGHHDWWSLGDLGVLYLLAGRYNDATIVFERLVSVRPDEYPLKAMASVLAKVWSRALEFDPELSAIARKSFVALGGDENELTPRTTFASCFISYSSQDDAFATKLHDDLEASGVECWFAPKDIRIGDPVLFVVDQAIRAHDKVVLILSKHSIDSDWVEHEARRALDREANNNTVVLFPIRIDDAVFRGEFGWAKQISAAHRPTGRHIGDFSGWSVQSSYQKSFERLLRDLSASDARKSAAHRGGSS